MDVGEVLFEGGGFLALVGAGGVGAVLPVDVDRVDVCLTQGWREGGKGRGGGEEGGGEGGRGKGLGRRKGEGG